MEWRETEARRFSESKAWSWDMVNSPHALAGYIRHAPVDSCRAVAANIEMAGEQHRSVLGITFEKGWTDDSVCYEISRDPNGDSAVVAEFTIPWSRIQLDSVGAYDIWIQATTTCGDTVNAHVVGNRFTPYQRIMTPRLWLQIAIVAVLLIAYLYMRVRIIRQRRTHRTQ